MIDYAHPETLVDTNWLSKHLDDPHVRIIEMDLTSEDYDKGHIRGAVFWNTNTVLKPNLQTNFDSNTIEKLLANSGIENDTTVIAVHNSHAASSGWIFWFLKVFGHADIRILNGGRQKWIEDGFTLTTEVTAIDSANYQAQSPNNNLRISLAEVKHSIDRDDTIMLDVRTLQEYIGEIYLMNPPTEEERGGHIRGAVHLDYQLAHNGDGTFKSAEQLQEIFCQQGVTPDKLIIPYCAVGGRSGHVWFILKYLLGYPHVKNYDGSWNEWSRIPNLPVEK